MVTTFLFSFSHQCYQHQIEEIISELRKIEVSTVKIMRSIGNKVWNRIATIEKITNFALQIVMDHLLPHKYIPYADWAAIKGDRGKVKVNSFFVF